MLLWSKYFLRGPCIVIFAAMLRESSRCPTTILFRVRLLCARYLTIRHLFLFGGGSAKLGKMIHFLALLALLANSWTFISSWAVISATSVTLTLRCLSALYFCFELLIFRCKHCTCSSILI